MQQVAAHKTDIAALPFSTSSTAKAVETGIGTHQETSSGNNQAFNRLYQEAKSSKSDFVLNEKDAVRPQSSDPKSASETPASASASNDSLKGGKDREAGHTDLPSRDTVTDKPAESDAEVQHASQKDNPTMGTQEIAEDPNASAQPTTDDEEDTHLAVENAEGNIKQIAITDTQFIIGDGGKKDAEAGVITTPGSPDEKPIKDEGEPDWVAYVDTVAARLGKEEKAAGGADTKINNGISAVEDEAINVISIKESGKLWSLPDDVNASDASSVLAHLVSQLNSDKSEGDLAIESLSTEAKETLSALTALLLNADSSQGDGDSQANTELFDVSASANANSNTENSSELSSLIAQLMQQTESAGDNTKTNSADIEDADVLDGVLTSTESSADESLVLSLLSDALNDLQGVSSTDASLHAEAMQAEMIAAGSGEISASTTTDKIAPSESDLKTSSQASLAQSVSAEAAGDRPVDLLTAISELSPQSAQKATEAFAERVVAAMPSGPQQQAVKTNIIAGINEFQQQVLQGREPGIDLSSIVADAAKEAAVNTEVIASMTTRLDSQASQFLNLMTQTQASAQQAFASMVGQADTVIQENSQLRAEASKSQQQFEGFDKAVNIHKPEGQQQLNEKIRWMVNARNTMAEIRLDPPEMGSMQVRVNVAGDAASVSFVVQSQQAKEALADAMPKLRDMLSEQGIELGDAQVRKDNSSGNDNGQQLANDNSRGNGAGNRGENDGLDDMDETRIIEQSVTREAKGGIDFYA
ncbi:flagellar hook-length control protein FliK [Alteromonas portus]|uniref:flagellar hook-length control protein FliK n=1 Tax=Alteromonas portus TaxID=2565549 RepID=UPI003BF8136A